MPATTKKSASADAIEMLKEDHRNVKELFKRFEKLEGKRGADEKQALVERICDELTVHSTIEEEIFYPAARAAIDDDDLMDEADVEHASLKDLVAQLEGADPDDDHYDARVSVLSEYVNHHVKEEEGQMFPKARRVVDVEALAAALANRKAELQGGEPRAAPLPVRSGTSRRKSTSRSTGASGRSSAQRSK